MRFLIAIMFISIAVYIVESDCLCGDSKSTLKFGTLANPIKLIFFIGKCGPYESCVQCSCESKCTPVVQACNELFVIGCRRCQCDAGYLRTGTDGCILQKDCTIKG